METVVITGANRGVGLALARRFLAADWRVWATSRRPEGLDAIAALGDINGTLQARTLDVTDVASVRTFHADLATTAVDVLINNAGVLGNNQGIADMNYETWMYELAVNAVGPFRMTTTLLPNLKRAARPRVVTLSSQMGSLGRPGGGDYAYRSSKAAVNKVMQTLAVDLAKDRIIVCPVHPGWVRTSMGGSSAPISADACAEGLFRFIDGLTLAHSGRFWTREGKEHPW